MAKVLDEGRIEKLTTNLFAGVGRVDVLTKLLEYDQPYIVGADTIEFVGKRNRDFSGSRCAGLHRRITESTSRFDPD